MPEITTIAAMLTGLKNATDLVKAVSQASGTLERAELKFKLSEIYEALAEARMAAIELTDQLQAKDKEIARLLEINAIKGDVIKGGDAVFMKDEAGKPTGDPFCLHCWNSKLQLTHLISSFTLRLRPPICVRLVRLPIYGRTSPVHDTRKPDLIYGNRK